MVFAACLGRLFRTPGSSVETVSNIMTTGKNNVPAIAGGKPVREEFLPFFRPSIDEGDVDSVAQTLRSGWLTLGPQTAAFEQQLK